MAKDGSQDVFVPHSDEDIQEIFEKDLFTVCVFCGASAVAPIYLEAARDLGHHIGRTERRLVYGSGLNGMMGEVAKACNSSGAQVVGIVPSAWAPYSQPELCEKFSATVHARSLEHRRTEMMSRSHAVIALPGGFGTDDEFTEVIAVNQTYRYDNALEKRMPLILVNTNGYYDHYIEHVKNGLEEGFRSQEDMGSIFVVDTPAQAAAIVDIFEDEGWDGLNAQASQCTLLNYQKNSGCFSVNDPQNAPR